MGYFTWWLYRTSENHCQLKEYLATEEAYVSPNKMTTILENEEHFSSHATLSLNVKDPREFPNKSTTVSMDPTLTEVLCDAQQATCKELANMEGISEKNGDLPSTSWLKLEDNRYDNSDLWGATTRGLRPPYKESVISKERHCMRIVNFCLDDDNSGETNSLTKEQCSRSCPILLLKNDKKELTIG